MEITFAYNDKKISKRRDEYREIMQLYMIKISSCISTGLVEIITRILLVYLSTILVISQQRSCCSKEYKEHMSVLPGFTADNCEVTRL